MSDVIMLGSQTLHGIDAEGARWITSRDRFNWDDGPAGTISPEQRARRGGALAGMSYPKALHPTLGGTVYASSEDDLEAAQDRLKAACSFDSTHLTVQRGSSPRWMSVRREDEVLFTILSPTKASWSIQLVATDPRKFGAPLTASTGLPTSSGGLSWPLSWPLPWPAVTTSGQVSLTNAGNVVGPVTVRIDGPCPGPIVTHVGPGGLSQVVALMGYTVGFGEFLTIDMEARTVLAQGQATRANFLTSRRWFGFEPGVNTFAFAAASSSPGALMTVTASPTWG